MNATENRPTVLDSMKVLDLTDIKGMLCGKFLASLGAEVLKVERPGGDKERFIPPFVDSTPDVEKSTYYAFVNANKKSITLDITTDDGKEIFKRLVKESDVVLESFTPGYLDSLGLGYAALEKINPSIIMTSITPFGQYGPYSQYKATDLSILAMSGLMHLIGRPGQTPLRVSVPQGYALGGAEGFAGTMIAWLYRQKTGIGQHVDVCARNALIEATINILCEYESSGRNMNRGGVYWALFKRNNRMVWPCKDGFVTFRLHGGSFAAKTNKALVEWMQACGMSNEFLDNFDFDNLDMDTADQSIYDAFEEPVGEFFKTKTKEELHKGCFERNIMLLPVADIDEVAKNPQLASRNYFVDVEVPQWGKTVKFPGSFTKNTETDLVPVEACTTLGAYNEEVYVNRLGMSAEDLNALAGAKVI